MAQPPIPLRSTGMIFNDMINVNVRGSDKERTRIIETSGLLDRQVKWVAELRKLKVPIFWVRVERRADEKDRRYAITDVSVKANLVQPPPVSRGKMSQNIDELPVQPEDQEILKPRFSPFAGTELDLQLRARRIDTILLGGIATNRGVESCARSGFDLDYNVVVLRDVCWSDDPEAHEWSLNRSLPAFARVMTTSEARDLLS